ARAVEDVGDPRIDIAGYQYIAIGILASAQHGVNIHDPDAIRDPGVYAGRDIMVLHAHIETTVTRLGNLQEFPVQPPPGCPDPACFAHGITQRMARAEPGQGPDVRFDATPAVTRHRAIRPCFGPAGQLHFTVG